VRAKAGISERLFFKKGKNADAKDAKDVIYIMLDWCR